MRDYVSLYTLLECDGDLRTFIESGGLALTTAHLGLQVRSLSAARQFSLIADVQEKDYEARVQEPTLTLAGEAVIEGDWQGTDRLGVWDGKDGAYFATRVGVTIHAKPDEVGSYSPLCQTAHLKFISDPFHKGLLWQLIIPLSAAEIEALCDAVEKGTAAEIRILACIEDLFERSRDFVPPVHQPTDYFALPASLAIKKEMPAPFYRPDVSHMPCGLVMMSVEGRTLRSREVAKREKAEKEADRLWVSKTLPIAEQQVGDIRTVRDALRLIAVALLLIFVALLF